MFGSFLTNKMSLASHYMREMAISLLHSSLVINIHVTFGLRLHVDGKTLD